MHILTQFVAMIDTFSGDNKVVDPGPLSEGFARYAKSDMEHFVFEFLFLDWKKLLKKNLFVTPSDIAFILSLIKNGMGMWDQARRQQDNPTQEESKALPLFTKGEGRKRESGMTVWNNEGRNFYNTAKKNWKKVYNNKDELSNLCTKWEQWEPEDKSRKNPVRTYWRNNEEQTER